MIATMFAFKRIARRLGVTALLVGAVASPGMAWAIEIPDDLQDAIPRITQNDIEVKGNNGDTRWTYYADQSYTMTESRRKEDATSVYIYPDYMSPDMYSTRIRIYGSGSEYGAFHNMTVGTTVVINKNHLNKQYRIRTDVYETYMPQYGQAWARLWAGPDVSSGVSSGLWSPDSMGNYTPLN